MPQNVLVSVLGEGEYLPHLVRAILEIEVIPAPRAMMCASVRMTFPL